MGATNRPQELDDAALRHEDNFINKFIIHDWLNIIGFLQALP